MAVKVFRLDLAPELAHAVGRELARLVDCDLAHPAIVQLLASGVEGFLPYLALEYVAAESLDTALRHYAPAGLDAVVPIVAQLAEAVDHAAARGVLHGALHPRDVFLAPDQARATGFGILQILERLGVTSPTRRPYSAPERVAGRSWGLPADVFSLGALAFELLTGRRLPGPGAAVDLAGAQPEVAENTALQRVLAAAVDDAPEARYPSGAAFAEAFQEAVAHRRFSAPKPAGIVVSMTAERSRSRHRPSQSQRPNEQATEGAPAEPPHEPVGVVPPEDPFARDRATSAQPRELRVELDEEALRFSRDEESQAEAATWEDALRIERPPPLPELSQWELASSEEATGTRAIETAAGERSEPARPARVEPRGPERAEPSMVRAPARLREKRDQEEPPPDAPAPPTRLLPYALVLMSGLLVGFVVGYGAGSRQSGTPPARGAGAVAPAEPPSATEANAPAFRAGPPPDLVPSPPPEVPDVTMPQATAEAARPIGPAAPKSGASARSAAAPAPSRQVLRSDTAPGRAASAPAGSANRPGRVVVRSTPAGAGVVIDGTWRGRTPLTVEELSLGSHTVRVVQPGYRPVNRRVTLTAGAPTATVVADLVADSSRPVPPAQAAPRTERPGSTPAGDARWGAVFVDSEPRGAHVWLDDRLVGTTPVLVPEVSPGVHRLRAERAGFRPWTTTIDVQPGVRARVTAALTGRR